VFEQIPVLKRLWAQYKALRVCQMVGIGIPYSEAEVIVLAWMLRLSGVRVIMMSATKYDDFPRRVWFEILKGLMLSVYRGAIVGGRRQAEYLRFLGFRRRPVLPGYNSVGLDRVREQGLDGAPARIAYEDRHFVFVGRFIAKKHLPTLLKGYASYVAQAGPIRAVSSWRAVVNCRPNSKRWCRLWGLPISSISWAF
jgi:glycosyltransferase involved in cell wall biosynthesis